MRATILVLATAFFQVCLATNIKARQSTPPGPTDPSTIPDCTYWELAFQGDDCDYLASIWGLTPAQFLSYNPSVKSDCSGFITGHAYCVEQNFGHGPSTTTTSKTITSSTSTTSTVATSQTPVGTPAPGQTQPGAAPNCNRWDLVSTGITCQSFINKYPGITLALLSSWNPAIGSTCSGLWAEYYASISICTSVEGFSPITSVIPPPSTTSGTSSTASPSSPSPTQAGVAPNCNRWDLVGPGTSCQTFINKYSGVTLALLYSWNPAIGASCTGLWADYYVCTGVEGFSTTPTTPPPSSTTSSTTSSPSVPSPTQPGVATNCNRWDLVTSGSSCQTFTGKYPGVTTALLYTWNPAIGAACTGLWLDYYICTGIEGFTPTITTAPVPSTTSSTPTGPSVPSPTQAGVAANCNRWDLVASGTSCQTFIAKYPGVTLALLYTWNPAIGSACTGLWLDYYICTSTEGFRPTISTTPVPSTTISTPTTSSAPGPTQAGVVANCNRWDLVASGSSCQTFINKYPGVTLALLYSWNPAIGSTCTGLWLDYYVCTGVEGFMAPTTSSTASSTTTSVSAPGPTQAGQPVNCNKWELVDSGETCDTIAAKYSPLPTRQLLFWNPAVGADCSGLWIGYYVCVGTTTYVPPTYVPTTLATTTISAPAAGGPTQSGQPPSCRLWYQVVVGDSCEGIVARFGGFSLAKFYAWNPAVGTDCGGLWLGYFVCVGASG